MEQMGNTSCADSGGAQKVGESGEKTVLGKYNFKQPPSVDMMIMLMMMRTLKGKTIGTVPLGNSEYLVYIIYIHMYIYI